VTDPFAVLGLPGTASLDEVRAARRRLAKELHPDRSGGDEAAMRRINQAFDLAVKAVRARRAGATADGPGTGGPAPAGANAGAGAGAGAHPTAGRPSRPAPPPPRSGVRRRWVEQDTPSFTIDVLPAVAFEALLVAATWIGEPVIDDPPYALEVLLDEPARCWCRLDLVPEAGGSTVSVTVAAAEDGPFPPPSAEAVRDVWVAAVNRLGAGSFER